VKKRAEAYKSQMMNHIRLYVLTVFLFLSFTVDADFNSTLLLANQGDAAAQTQIGESYYKGEGVSPSYTEAVKWFRLAANQGYSKAQNNLGYMYEEGYGNKQNYEEAIKLYQLAAIQGNPRAQYHLGYLYSQGYGVSRNELEATRLFRLAAEQGDATAQSFLGSHMLSSGKSFEAVKWFRLAAAQGDSNVQYILGTMYEYGNNVAEDRNEAIKWFRLAADNGNLPASNHLKSLETIKYSKSKALTHASKPTPAITNSDPLNIRD
jgi:uncharacterized protein